MNRYAFFDVDNTIYDGYTAADFFLYLIQKGLAPKKIEVLFSESVHKYQNGEIDYNEIAKLTLNLCSESVKGMSKGLVESNVQNMLVKKERVFFEWVKPVLSNLRESNFNIALISAAPDFVIKEIAKMLEIQDYYSTRMDIIDNIYTGKEPKILNDDKKVQQILNITTNSHDLLSIGFGDSEGDIPMLESLDHAFVFENDHHPDMMKYAEKRKWTIFTDADKVIDTIKNLN